MAQSYLQDTWLKEFNEALTLSDDIAFRLREWDSIIASGGDPSLLISATRRKFTVLGTCLDRLESLLQNPPEKLSVDERELYHRQDILMGIKYKTKEMAANFSTSISSYREPQVGDKVAEPSVTPEQHVESGAREARTMTVGEDSKLHTRLLGESTEATGCSCQLLCLIILGVAVLVLIVCTIARMF